MKFFQKILKAAKVLNRSSEFQKKWKNATHHFKKETNFIFYKTSYDLNYHFHDFIKVHWIGLICWVHLSTEPVYVWVYWYCVSVWSTSVWKSGLQKNLRLKAFWMTLKPNYKNLAPIVATNAHTRNNYNLRNFPYVFRK